MMDLFITLLVYGLLALFNGFYIIGFNRACQYETDDSGAVVSKMVFANFRLWCEKHIGEYWSKPICTCTTCMASVHGTIVFVAFTIMSSANDFNLLTYLFYIFAVAGFANKLDD